MITALVRFPLPPGTTREQAKALYETTIPFYAAVPGLKRKYYLYDETPSGGGVYLWNDRATAEAFYSDEWKAGLKERLGAEPQVTLFETPAMIND